jgi:hypothetical protein
METTSRMQRQACRVRYLRTVSGTSANGMACAPAMAGRGRRSADSGPYEENDVTTVVRVFPTFAERQGNQVKDLLEPPRRPG